MATTLQILRKARKLIEKPERWCKGDAAKDRAGENEDVMSRKAAAFCMAGAVVRASGGWCREYYTARDHVEAVIGSHALDALAEWNDAPRRTHAQVLRAFDKAIAKLEAKGKAVQR